MRCWHCGTQIDTSGITGRVECPDCKADLGMAVEVARPAPAVHSSAVHSSAVHSSGTGAGPLLIAEPSPPIPKRKFRLGPESWVIIVLTGLCFAAAGYQFYRANLIVTTFHSAEGVVNNKEKYSGQDSKSWKGVILYRDNKGNNYSTDSNADVLEVGDKVDLMYNPANPGEVYTSDEKSIWGWAYAFSGAGVLLTMVGLIVAAMAPAFRTDPLKAMRPIKCPKCYSVGNSADPSCSICGHSWK